MGPKKQRGGKGGRPGNGSGEKGGNGDPGSELLDYEVSQSKKDDRKGGGKLSQQTQNFCENSISPSQNRVAKKGEK